MPDKLASVAHKKSINLNSFPPTDGCQARRELPPKRPITAGNALEPKVSRCCSVRRC